MHNELGGRRETESGGRAKRFHGREAGGQRRRSRFSPVLVSALLTMMMAANGGKTWGLGGCDGRLICPAAGRKASKPWSFSAGEEQEKKDVPGQRGLGAMQLWLCGRVSCFW